MQPNAPFQVQWNPSHKPDQGRELEDLPSENGSWEYNGLYRDLFVAKEWGFKDPLEFWNLPKISRILMIAFVEVSGEMQAFDMKTKA